MKRTAIALTAAVAFFATLAAQTPAPEKADAAAIAKIRDEGLNRSQVKETLFWMSDAKGPRLTGSASFEDAGEWVVKQLQSWGVSNVRKERWKFGKGWALTSFHATMASPQVMPIIGLPKAWTPGINGTITTDVVMPKITSAADCQRLKGTLAGKIILTQPARVVAMLDQGSIVMRMDDNDGKIAKEALTMPPPRGRGAGAGGGGRGAAGGAGAPAPTPPADPCVAIGEAATAAAAAAARGRGAAGAAAGTTAVDPDDPAANAPAAGAGAGGGRGGGLPAAITRFYRSENVLALFDRGSDSFLSAGGSDLSWQAQRVDGGTIFVQSGAQPTADPAVTLPQVTLAVEHYNRMVRLIEHNIPVTVELNIGTKFTDERPDGGGFNIVGEIPGSDLADQIVLIGAHFDSWHGATGATDNGTGSTAMMEVLRILKATGLKPRRTIRIGLWGGEENGLLGSKAYAAEHLGTRQAPKPELANMAAYFNLDNGTGKIRGIWMQANPAVEPIFRAWSAPLEDLGVTIFGPRTVASTDHTSFDTLGVPAFQFVQERLEYNSRTHHSNMDFYDRVQFDDLKQQATVTAVFAWHAANRDQLLPRKQ